MPFVPKTERRAALEELRVDEGVIRLGEDPTDVHPLFEWHCRDPYYCYETPCQPSERLIPLWEWGMRLFVARQAHSLEFLELSLEDPEQELTKVGSSVQGLLARLFLAVIDSQDWDDDQETRQSLAEAAAAVGFEHLAETLELVEMKYEGGWAAEFTLSL